MRVLGTGVTGPGGRAGEVVFGQASGGKHLAHHLGVTVGTGYDQLNLTGAINLGGGTRTITVDNTGTTTFSGAICSMRPTRHHCSI